jgi:hypothetical protein
MRTVDLFNDCAKFNLEDRHTVIILLVVSCPAKMNVLSLDINVFQLKCIALAMDSTLTVTRYTLLSPSPESYLSLTSGCR